MCDNGTSSKLSLRLDAAELASLLASVLPVVSRLCQIVATSEFIVSDREALLDWRDWVDRAYVQLVELAELAASRVDLELEELETSSRPQPPLNDNIEEGGEGRD